MGLIAWVADALIAWLLFPDASFTTLVLEQDSQRTLYMRSVVVGLFFLFGLLAGHFINQVEALRETERRHNRMLQGILSVHEAIVGIEEEDALLRKVREEIKRSFGLDEVKIRSLPEEVDPLVEVEPTRDLMCNTVCQRYFDRYMKRLESREAPFEQICCEELAGESCFCGPLSFQGKLYGVFYARGKEVPDGHEWFLQGLNALLPDLGHALARLRGEARRKEQTRRLEALYENAPVGIFSSTTGGKLLYLNPAMAEMVDAESPQQVLESCESVRQFYRDPERRAEFLRRVEQRGWLTDFALDLVSVKGRVLHTRFAARMTEHSFEGERVIEGFILDETRKVESERQAEVLRERLAQSRHLEAIAGLASGIAHEFNNILQVMMGSAYLVQMQVEAESSAADSLREIQDSGARAARLCDQMLMYAGKKFVTLRIETVDDLVASFRADLKTRLPGDAKFHMHLDAPGARVRLEPASLLDILVNLVENAQESVIEGPADIFLETRCLEPDGSFFRRYGIVKEMKAGPYWALFVRDKGQGMDDEVRKRVFDPFFTTKFQGRGLGLAAVRGILDKFDGAIGVSSGPGKGSEFVVILPLVAQAEKVEPTVRTERPKVEGGMGERTVLVVDDEPLVREMVARFLDQWGFPCRRFADGVEVMEWLADQPSNDNTSLCMLLDVVMPRMGGLETLSRLQASPIDIPVLLMSGFEEEDMLLEFEGHALAGFLHKPFTAERLLKELNRVFQIEE